MKSHHLLLISIVLIGLGYLIARPEAADGVFNPLDYSFSWAGGIMLIFAGLGAAGFGLWRLGRLLVARVRATDPSE